MTQIAPAPARTRRAFWRDVADIIATLAVAMLLAAGLRTVAFQPFTIPSSSMEPGLVTGDYIVVSKFAYGWSTASLPGGSPTAGGRRLFGRDPARGDVVVFRRPHDPGEVWVKRVIGLPGDEVRVRNGVVLVNGQPLERTPLRMTRDHDAPERVVMEVEEEASTGRRYVTYDEGPGMAGDDTDAFRVPAGHYFMMGDNRDNSLDSRWPREIGVGLLPAENIVGRAAVVLASWRAGASLWKPWTWLNLQPDRFLLPIR
ncbi:signal peptidase I [Brevundimonas sp. PAMC22021]|uniref:signal peptidase I n=1 Tax=Brevundimonas sp. PAMC22021 TaxID=2861285 RepID=UPI001C6291B7|nr:signal peptidase I [Brevundimonas sp. PAMC22021]QYF85719.1 signal peptidase I [Brevundimonas sp. PAMC22021]